MLQNVYSFDQRPAIEVIYWPGRGVCKEVCLLVVVNSLLSCKGVKEFLAPPGLIDLSPLVCFSTVTPILAPSLLQNSERYARLWSAAQNEWIKEERDSSLTIFASFVS